MDNQVNKPLFFYGEKEFSVKKNKETIKVKRRFALAGVIDNKGIINIGRAVCSEKDQFTKFKAHKIAVGRANKPKTVFSMVKVPEGEKPTTAFINFAKKQLKEEE